ncbi:hypothetical protein SJI00_03030 [Pseudomonas sp. RP23018S]|uniref:hypothetical protein n=1 Tax=Pseudomonas sp. RP23018S TaxID=3096037 RepID=UPI002ACAA9C3|nr:hypothetical protein [Pseudomonas sp. RP23018S]MDZ5601753.1 hypothetical protein [Pseudomonas sp. RP23018S]
MNRTIQGMSKACGPLLNEAMAALRRYHEAQAAADSPEQIERLRLAAESAFQAVTDYHLHETGQLSIIKH